MCHLDECVEFLSRGSADGDGYMKLDIFQFDQEFLDLRALDCIYVGDCRRPSFLRQQRQLHLEILLDKGLILSSAA